MIETFSFSDNFDFSSEYKKFFNPLNIHQNELMDFALSHEELKNQLEKQIKEKINSELDKTKLNVPGNPFSQENNYIQNVQKLSSSLLLSSIAKIEKEIKETHTGQDNNTDFEFYENKVKEKKESEDLLSRNLKNDLEASLNQRYINWQLKLIDEMRRSFLEELYKNLEKLKKLNQLISDFSRLGRFIDFSKGIFDDYGFELLERYADLLKNDQSLQQLAELIGRLNNESEHYEKELRSKVELKTEFTPKRAYKGQISGIRLSGEISSTLPSELALYKNPVTKLYFAQKFIEQKLLSYAYINKKKEYSEKQEEVFSSIKDKKGPVIICVDTSGSMHGTPETVAKTITFALAKKCIEEDRNVFLISFSTGIEVQDLTLFNSANALQELICFLRKSFNGGTDASPALAYAVELLGQNQWKKADVLMISDFVMDTLEENLLNVIQKQKDCQTKFYALTIGATGNNEVINGFDRCWIYNQNDPNSCRFLSGQLYEIMNH